MQKWEYMVVGLKREEGSGKWIVSNLNGWPADSESMFTFIDRKGEEGWELVNVIFITQTEKTEGTAFYQATTEYHEIYRLFFKRSK